MKLTRRPVSTGSSFRSEQSFEEAPQHLIPPKEPECGRFLARVLIHLVHVYGAYAHRVRATFRKQDTAASDETELTPPKRAINKRWAELIYRIYEVDPLTCPRCESPMKLLAFITEPALIRKILNHLDIKASERAPSSPSSPLASTAH
jgi:hypothetical protein